jgi:hypothetical protein
LFARIRGTNVGIFCFFLFHLEVVKFNFFVECSHSPSVQQQAIQRQVLAEHDSSTQEDVPE